MFRHPQLHDKAEHHEQHGQLPRSRPQKVMTCRRISHSRYTNVTPGQPTSRISSSPVVMGRATARTPADLAHPLPPAAMTTAAARRPLPATATAPLSLRVETATALAAAAHHRERISLEEIFETATTAPAKTTDMHRLRDVLPHLRGTGIVVRFH